MGVLKSLKNAETVQMAVKVPVELHGRLTELKKTLKARDCTIDIGEAVVRGIRRLLSNAEAELKSLEQKESKTNTAPKPSAKVQPKP